MSSGEEEVDRMLYSLQVGMSVLSITRSWDSRPTHHVYGAEPAREATDEKEGVGWELIFCDFFPESTVCWVLTTGLCPGERCVGGEAIAIW